MAPSLPRDPNVRPRAFLSVLPSPAGRAAKWTSPRAAVQAKPRPVMAAARRGAIVSKLGLAGHLTRRRAAGCASRLTVAAPFG
jgi:hypothetical protein